MNKAILGKKIGMTQIFDEEGLAIPVTVIEAGPCSVVQKKTIETDGYNAIKIGFDDISERKLNKPERGLFSKVNVSHKRHLKEFRLEDCDKYEVGQEIKVNDMFAEGDLVDVSGISKGKGYQGATKRHGFAIGRKSHGSKYHRGSGSMGSAATPGRVFKGKKLPGHMGAEKVTIQNLDVIKVDAERNLLLVKGSVPGPKGGLLIIKEAVKFSK